MKKISYVLIAALAVAACQKSDVTDNEVFVSIPVKVESPASPTKASIVIDGNKFTPSLTDKDMFALMPNTSASQTYKFTYSKTDNAISGSYPAASSTTGNVRYIVVNCGSGYAGSAAKFARFEIEANQTNKGGEFGKNLMLVGVTDECALGDAPSLIEFKTMCSLLEFDVTNSMSDKAYLESIKLEAVGGEQIAGRFAISKTYSADWMNSYSEDSGIKAENKSASVTVDCGKAEITSTSTPFYAACAFGKLSQGLKVTFTLSFDDGSKSQMVKTYGESGLTLARNTLYQTPIAVSSKGTIVSFESVNVSDVSNKGDVITLKYTVTNPVDGETISATSDASWVNTFDYSTAGELSFVVDANEGIARTANITVSYKNAVPVTITVSQLKADAAKVQYSVTYTVSSTSAVTTSGTAPTGSSATFKNTYTTANQMISGKSQTYTLSGYNGKTIKKVVLSMKSNKKAGAGTFSLKAGETSLAEIKDATTFNNWFDNTAYSTDFKDVTVTLTNDKYVIQTGENVVLVIAATVNSLYCQSVTITYE
jgi:hypothetical protein